MRFFLTNKQRKHSVTPEPLKRLVSKS